MLQLKKKNKITKIQTILNNICNTDIVKFDVIDYINNDTRKNLETIISLARSIDDYKFEKDDIEKYSPSELVEMWMDSNMNKINILKPEILNKIENNKLYTSNTLNKYIDDDLKKKDNPFTGKRVSDVIDYLKEKISNKQSSFCLVILEEYNKGIDKIQNMINKLKDLSANNTEQTDGSTDIQIQVKMYESVIKQINDNIKIITVLSRYSAKLEGFATQAVFSLSTLMD